MSPRAYMLTGAAAGLVIAVAEIMLPELNVGWTAFASGMLFGKGYGIWEERQRVRSHS